MFIQVIQGRITDKGEVRSALDRWQAELAPGATGWQGTTCGITDDDYFVGLVRFDSPDSARRNSDRPQQHQWWTETSKLFAGEVTFHDCQDVEVMLGGGRDDAGFVQIIQGRVRDVNRMRELGRRFEPVLQRERPDVLGGTVAMHGDGFTQAVYFSSERDAREGEKKELPADAREAFQEQMSLMEDVKYYDLREPLIYSPR